MTTKMSGMFCTILWASLACLWFGQGSDAFDPPVCDALVDVFGDRTVNKIETPEECKQLCRENTDFTCRAVYFSDTKLQCVLSETVRKEPLLSGAGSRFKYYERTLCEETDLTSKITGCDASAQYNVHYACQYAYDGSSIGGVNNAEWAIPAGRGVGEYMKVNLDNYYKLTSVWIRHRCHQIAQVSGWQIDTAAGEVAKVTRTCGGTTNYQDCTGEGNDWFVVDIASDTPTSWIKFTMTDVCDTQVAGIREIKVMGYPIPEIVNLTPRIESCTASSEYNTAYGCQYAYEGSDSSSSVGKEWAMKNGLGVGGWMKVYLDKEYPITQIMIRHRCHKNGQVNGWKIETNTGSEIAVKRTCGGTNSWTDCSGDSNDWKLVPLPANTRASWVNFTITSVCGTTNVGIREIRIMGYDHGTPVNVIAG